jgi:hypothetical protein
VKLEASRFRATGEILFLASPSKSIQKEGDPVPLISCAASQNWAAS